MTETKFPTWLAGHVKTWEAKRLPTVTLCSDTGNEFLEVWYYGNLLSVQDESQSYIVDGDEGPGLVRYGRIDQRRAYALGAGQTRWD